MLSDLSPSQREAVCCGPGPCEVIAGPGSGKTLVLTERILYLLEHFGIAPSRILVLTFSRSAAVEMRDRFMKRTGGSRKGVLFGTFHSVFFYILKESTHREYRLIGDAERDRLLNRLICRYYPDPFDRPSLEEAEKMLRTGAASGLTQDSGILQDYRTFLKENGLVDFDEMISGCRKLLEEDKKVRDHWSSRFAAILVDEFQDINREQYEILRLLSSGRGLFVVGDDDQSIYGFRGSTPSVMTRFITDYPDARRIFLSRNYRCSGCICRAASLLISGNRMRIPKEMTAAGPPGDKTVLRAFTDDSLEFSYLLGEMRKLTGEELDNTAIIVRTNTHAAKIEKYLSGNGIPCSGQVNMSRNILSTAARDLEAYIILAEGMKRDMLPRNSFYRVMNRPQRFLLRSVAPSEFIRPSELCARTKDTGEYGAAIREFMRDLRTLGTLDPAGFVRFLYNSVGYAEWAAGNIGGREEVSFVLDRILALSSSCKDLREIPRVILNSGSMKGSAGTHGVRIMTMHVSKGLEFDRVYLPALNEGVIPGRRCSLPSDFEEERRLLYVAMTRARSHLELMYTTGTGLNPRPPSRFLSVYGVRGFVTSGR